MASGISIKIVFQDLWHCLPATMYPVGRKKTCSFALSYLQSTELKVLTSLSLTCNTAYKPAGLFPRSSTQTFSVRGFAI